MTSAVARALLRGARHVAGSGIPAARQPWAAQGARVAQGFPVALQKMGFANVAETEIYNRQRKEIILENRVPVIARDAFVAPNAVVVGDVDIDDRASVWHGCVLRGDLNAIRVGAYTNVQDRTVMHAARSSPTGLSAATTVGRYCSIGAKSVLRSTTVEDEVVIGSNCILLEGSMVEKHAILAAHTVVPPGRRIPSGELWAGNPAQYVRDVTKDEIMDMPTLAEKYYELAWEHEAEDLPYSTAYLEVEKIKEALAKPE